METVDYIVAGCGVLALTDYTEQHNWVTFIIHQDIFVVILGFIGEQMVHCNHSDGLVETDDITRMLGYCLENQ